MAFLFMEMGDNPMTTLAAPRFFPSRIVSARLLMYDDDYHGSLNKLIVILEAIHTIVFMASGDYTTLTDSQCTRNNTRLYSGSPLSKINIISN